MLSQTESSEDPLGILTLCGGFEGIEHQKTVEGNTTFDAEAAMIDDTYMTGKISVKNHPFVEHF